MFSATNIIMEAVCGGLDGFVVSVFDNYLTVNGRVVWFVIIGDCVSVWLDSSYSRFVFNFDDIDGICNCIAAKIDGDTRQATADRSDGMGFVIVSQPRLMSLISDVFFS